MNVLHLVHNYANGLRIVTDWLGHGGHVVSPEQAQARADVCTGRLSGSPCPKNGAPITVEKEVAEGIKTVVELKNHLKLRVLGEKKLHTCHVCLCHLPTKVHVPLEHIMRHTSPEELNDFVDGCWLRSENGL
jgi:hypothetical protein